MGNWIKVNEENPPIGEKVLICLDGEIKIAKCYYHSDGTLMWGIDGGREYYSGARYWMPLPNLPN